MNQIVKHLVVICAVAVPLAGRAQAKPEEAIRARQAIMRVVALNFGPLGKMASGDAPLNKEMFQANAARVEALWAMNPGQYFIPGTEMPVAGAKIATFTDAKQEVWRQQEKFKAASDRASQSIAALAQAARSGDEKAMRGAAGEVGKSCKACHDDFRSK